MYLIDGVIAIVCLRFVVLTLPVLNLPKFLLSFNFINLLHFALVDFAVRRSFVTKPLQSVKTK
jgi:hypothetical protein